jgi:DNA-binding Xre family transcriptional regulator
MLSPCEVRHRLEVINIKALSEKIGVHPNTLYRLVNGGSINASTLEKISNYLEGKNNNE